MASQDYHQQHYGGYPPAYTGAAPYPPQPPVQGYPPPPPPPQGPIFHQQYTNPNPPLISSDEKPEKEPKWKEKASGLSSWRLGVLGCTITSVLVLLTNILLTTKAVGEYGSGDDGVGTLFQGNCAKARRSGTYIHLGINALSTILLSCSNYCMQCLSAPTRKDVDRAHTKKRWVKIGVARIANLRWVGWKKCALWCFLVLSSLPLHLLYNSAVFTTLISNQYDVYAVPLNQVNQFQKLLGNSSSTYERLETEDCIRSYATQLLSDRRNVGVVINANNSAAPLTSLSDAEDRYAATGFATNTGRLPNDWQCNSLGVFQGCNEKLLVDKFHSQGNVWRYKGGTVQYCLSERLQEKCRLQFSEMIMNIVIICNAIKVLCMVGLSLLGIFNEESPLVTIGDAISSFMSQPDVTLVGMCLASRDDVVKLWKEKGGYGAVSNTPPAAKQWKPIRRRWFRAPGIGAFLLTYLPALVLLGGVAILLFIGLGNLSEHNVPLSSLPFGSVDVRAIASINYYNAYLNFTEVALIANIPQLVLSILYFMYNNLYTSMYLSYEYESYSREKPKTLRVSRPRGLQRSNYFLSLPYRYSLPLMGGSLLLHWLFSQSLFLARVDQFLSDGTKYSMGSLTDLGYSPLGIILSMIVSIALMAVGLGFGFFRHYRGTIPMAGGNSAVISAHCLRQHEAFDAHLKHVSWGEMRETLNQPVGHCSFTNGATVSPAIGRFYS